MLTSASEQHDRLLGWSSGVDDYITKPIEPLELRTRILARVQKFHQRKARGETLSWSDLELNVTRHEVAIMKEGVRLPVEITPHEFKILYSLIRHEGQTLDRITLKQLVWGWTSTLLNVQSIATFQRFAKNSGSTATRL